MPLVTQTLPSEPTPHDIADKPRTIDSLLDELKGQTDEAAESHVKAVLNRQYFDNHQLSRLCRLLLKDRFLSAASSVITLINPHGPEHRCLSAKIAYLESRYVDAIKIWSNENSAQLSINDHFHLIDALERTNDLRSFVNETDQLALKQPMSENQLRRLACILLKQNRAELAIQLINNQKSIQQVNTFLVLAKAYRVNDNYIDALEVINKTKTKLLKSSQYQQLLNAEIKTHWHAKNYEQVVDCCNSMINAFPHDFPAHKHRLGALRLLGKRKSLLYCYQETFERFGVERPDIVLAYSRALDFDGQSKQAIRVLEQNCKLSKKLLPDLLKIYLRHGKFDQFIAAAKTDEVDSYDQLTILIDYFILSVRLGLYEKLPALLTTLHKIKPSNIKEHRAYIQCQIQLVQVHNILTSPSVDKTRVLTVAQRDALINQLENIIILKAKSPHTIDRSSWVELKQSQYATHSIELKNVSRTIDTYLDKLQNSKQVLLDTYEQPGNARKLATIIKERIEKRIPTSMIRLGDGEGMFLRYPEYVQENQLDDQQYIQNYWWGDNTFDQNMIEEKKATINAFNRALKNADIVGVPPVRRIVQSFDNLLSEKKEVSRQARGILGVINSIDLFDHNSTILTSCHVHSDLEIWDGYLEILNEVNELHLITCHSPLSDIIRERFGISTVVTHAIPGEARFNSLFGQNSEKSHFPEVFEELTQTLPTMANGKLFLVGAGFLGKIYCDLIKRHGGIALDVGSMMDRWAGFGQTRVSNELGQTCQGLRYTDCPPKQLELPVRSQTVFTNHYRNRLLPITFSEAHATPCQFLISGHPRSGTGYAASLFAAFGYKLGHEKLDSHGMSSWIHAVNDLNMPEFGPKANRVEYSREQLAVKHLIMIVRDPKHVIPSIMIENRNDISYRFRRYHILNRCGIDLEDCESAIECAIESYLCWLEILEKQQPDCTLHLEDIDSESRSFLSKNGYTTPAMRIDLRVLKRNATSTRYNIEKPAFDSKLLASIDNSLYTRLNKFCVKHGYKIDEGF